MHRHHAKASWPGLLAALSVVAAMGAVPAAAAVPSDFETPEYFASGALAQIGASEAYALGFTGAGVTIAIFDTGIDPAHPEFAGKTISGYDFFFDTYELSDLVGHGTHVAGIAAAGRDGVGMHGVAYDADIMSFNSLLGATLTSSMERLFAGVDMMIENGVRIVNGSWITFYDRTDPDLLDYLYTNFKHAVDNEIIFVFGAGNFGDEKPWDPADTPEIFPDLQKQFIAVVAVDENNVIAGFSNRCGNNAAWCIAAPGVDIYSTVPGGGYEYMSGTSMAAPLVSGALAVLEQAFPYLTSEQLVQMVLTTATEMGDPDTYGRGLLNLGAAVRGVGAFETDWTIDTDGHVSSWFNNIGGPGGLTKSGAGVLILNGANTYAGGTTVAGGMLVIGDAAHPLASIVNAVTVHSGGILRGHGTIFGSVMNGGGVNPGASVGILNIAGDYIQNASGSLIIDVEPAAASQLLVGGVASLDGAFRVVYAPGAYPAAVHSVLEAAGGVSGRFNAVSGTRPDMLQFLTYAPNQLNLTLQPSSSDIVPSLATAQIETVHRSNREWLSRAGSGEGAWIKAVNAADRFDATDGARGFKAAGTGLAFGVSGRFDADITFGAAGAFTRLDVDPRGGAPASGTADLYQAALYGGYAMGETAIALSASFGYADADTSRQFNSLSGPQRTSSGYGTWIGAAALQASRPFMAGAYSVTPRAGVSYAYLGREGATEQGAPGYDLTFMQESTQSLRAFAGVEVTRGFEAGGADILPALRLGLSRELHDDRRSADTMLAIGSSEARSYGVSPDRTVVEAGAGVRARLGERLDLRLDADAALPTGNRASYALSAALEFRF
ncbi:MAG: S8 family serine peptidase [Pseudomonadota bacterium]